MLINDGRIEIARNGAVIRLIHRGSDGQVRRVLDKQPFMSSSAWKRAIEDWLANYHEAMPLKRLDGKIVTVADYEGNFG